MKALIIVSAILVPLLLLLFANIRVSLIYDGRIRVRLSYLFLRSSLYPAKPRKKRGKKKTKKKKLTTAATHKVSGKSKKERRPLTFSDVRLLLRLFRTVLGTVLDRASRHVRITVQRLRITVGGEADAAKAAIEYGVISQLLSYLLAFLENSGFLRRRGVRDVDVSVDFLEKDHSFDARIDVHSPLIFLIPLLFSTLMSAITARNQWTRQRSKKLAKKNTTTKKESSHG